MTEFSVGDRVLVPGVVRRGGDPRNICVEVPRSVGLWFDASDLRRDVPAGRDLTAQDVREGLDDVGLTDEACVRVAEHLNRITRGGQR